MINKGKCLLGLFLILSLSACSLIKSPGSHPSTVQDKLINMEAYSAVATITRIDNGKANTYETKQLYQMDGRYRFEIIKPEHIAGLTTICNGDKIIQHNPKAEDPKTIELPISNFRNQIFLGSFVQNYLQSEDVAIQVQKIEESQTTVLEAIIPGGSRHMATQRLWMDQKTMAPVRMAIYNQDEEETVTIEFLEFTYNPEINQSIFTID